MLCLLCTSNSHMNNMQIYIHSAARTHTHTHTKNERKKTEEKSAAGKFIRFLFYSHLFCILNLYRVLLTFRNVHPCLASHRLASCVRPFIAFHVVQAGLLQYFNAGKQNIHAAHRTHSDPRLPPLLLLFFSIFIFHSSFSILCCHHQASSAEHILGVHVRLVTCSVPCSGLQSE